MLKQLTLVGAALAMTAGAVVPAAPAMAQRYDNRGSYNGYNGNGYNGQSGYNRSYRGDDQRYRNRARNRCDDGDGGTIVGAIAGGLAGNAVAGRGNRTVGTLIGGVLGALAGRSIDRSDRPGYCGRR